MPTYCAPWPEAASPSSTNPPTMKLTRACNLISSATNPWSYNDVGRRQVRRPATPVIHLCGPL